MKLWHTTQVFENDNDLVIQTFLKAFEKHKDVTGLIVHSDQGFQYTSLHLPQHAKGWRPNQHVPSRKLS